MTDWGFEENEVLVHPEDTRWWHVVNRLVDVDTDTWHRYYRLGDATHTEYQDLVPAEDVETIFERTGIVCSGKPAAEHGYRVNGVLCGPSEIDQWRGNKCIHDHACPGCGADGYLEIDIIVDHSESITRYICRGCGHEVQEDNE